jgi:hypothetical protein
VVETLRHYRDCGGKPALDFVRYGEREHELLAGCPCLLSRGENGPEIVTRVTEAARRHVAVAQIYLAHKTGVEERRLICGCLAAADQRAQTRSPVFLELFAKCLGGLSWQCGDIAAEAVQNIALEKSPSVVRNVLGPGGCRKGGDSLDR